MMLCLNIFIVSVERNRLGCNTLLSSSQIKASSVKPLYLSRLKVNIQDRILEQQRAVGTVPLVRRLDGRYV